jgi:hypothetical protein
MDILADAHATPDTYIDTDSDKYINANGKLHSHVDIYAQPYINGNFHAHTHHMDAYTDEYTSSHMDSLSDSYAASHRDADSDTIKDSHIYFDSHLNAFANTDPYQNCNGDGVTYAIENTDCIHDAITNSNLHTQLHSHTHADSALREAEHLFHG